MATYTGTKQAKPRVAKIWLGVVGFALAAALVIALVAMQGGSPAPISPGTRPALGPPNGGPKSGGSGTSWTPPQRF